MIAAYGIVKQSFLAATAAAEERVLDLQRLLEHGCAHVDTLVAMASCTARVMLDPGTGSALLVAAPHSDPPGELQLPTAASLQRIGGLGMGSEVEVVIDAALTLLRDRLTSGQLCVLELPAEAQLALLRGTLRWSEARGADGWRASVVDAQGRIAANATWRPDEPRVLDVLFRAAAGLTRVAFLALISDQLAELRVGVQSILDWLEDERRARIQAHVATVEMAWAAYCGGEAIDAVELRTILRECIELELQLRAQLGRELGQSRPSVERCRERFSLLLPTLVVRAVAAGLLRIAGQPVLASEHFKRLRESSEGLRGALDEAAVGRLVESAKESQRRLKG